MSKPKGIYPNLTELEYWEKVRKQEPYNGFVIHEDGTYSFVFSEFTFETKQETNSIGKFTRYSIIPKVKYHIFKPIRTTNTAIKHHVNPQKQDDRNPTASIKAIYCVSELWSSSFEKNFMKYYKGYYDANAKLKGLSTKPGYVSDHRTVEDANKKNEWVNDRGVFYVDNYGPTNSAEFINFLLGCMIFGVGSENLVFPTNGTISSSLKNAGIVKEALNLFYERNKGKTTNLISFSDKINGNKSNIKSILKNGFLHPETFLGSAQVTVEQYDKTSLKISIFNITSLTSGDLFKHLPNNEYPMSIIRNQLSEEWDHKTQYGNISQTFSFTIPINFSRLK